HDHVLFLHPSDPGHVHRSTAGIRHVRAHPPLTGGEASPDGAGMSAGSGGAVYSDGTVVRTAPCVLNDVRVSCPVNGENAPTGGTPVCGMVTGNARDWGCIHR